MAREFLRRLNHPEMWVEYQAQLTRGSTACPQALRDEIQETGGVSVFEIKDAAPIQRIAAALMLVRAIRPFRGMLIREDLVRAHGFRIQHTPQNAYVFDSTIRPLHHDIVPGARANSEALVTALAGQMKLVQFEVSDLVNYINNEMKNGWQRNDVYRYISIDPAAPQPSPNTGSLMADHWRKSYLHLAVPS